MLRITTSTSAKDAKRYYTPAAADYYIDGQQQELAGVWKGDAAKRLGLSGTIEQADWDAICDNRNPATGKRLTVRQQANRRIGFDFNWHVPKSASILYALTGDERILDALRESVGETMREMESEMKARERRDGRDRDYVTGNMLWGEFVHLTSRPVNGLPDPHLHAHCFVANCTWSDKESRWVAAQIGDLKRDSPYFEARFHSRMASRMMALGLSIQRTRKGWELVDIPKSAVTLFSRRTAQIEKLAREKGITDPHEKAELGARTRSRKQKNMTLGELREAWRAMLKPEDAATIDRVGRSIGGPAMAHDETAARAAVEYAASHCFERQSVVPERTVQAVAIKRSLGESSLRSVEDAFERAEFVTAEREGRRVVTTRDVLAEEMAMLNFARNGRGTCAKLGGGEEHVFRNKELNADQRGAVRHVLESRDRIILVRGKSGVGKTWSMRETVDAIEANGKKVFTLALSADASRGVLREEAKFADADTVARLLVDEKMQKAARGQVLWIDEASLLGTRTMGQVFRLADQLDARIILQGDRKQHGSVERGAALRLLETEAGLVPAEIREIKRQDGKYRDAVRDLSDGRIKDGFRKLDAMGWIREADNEHRYAMLAADYADTVAKGEKVLVIAPTHAEGRIVTKHIRDELRRRRRLGEDERTFKTLANAQLTEAQRSDAVCYCPGDVIQFVQNAKGIHRGQRLVVDDKAGTLPLDQAGRFQVFETRELKLAAGDLIKVTLGGTTRDGHRLNNGQVFTVKNFTPEGDIELTNGWHIAKDWGHIASGFCTTSHAAQGRSPDVVLIAQSAASFPASSPEQFYVSASRGRYRARIFTDNREELLKAVQHSHERLTATELVNDHAIRRRAMAIHHQLAELRHKAPTPQIEREAIVR